jgi:hypothetical protein
MPGIKKIYILIMIWMTWMQIYLRSLERCSACTTTAYGDAYIDKECTGNQKNAFPNRTRGMMDE